MGIPALESGRCFLFFVPVFLCTSSCSSRDIAIVTVILSFVSLCYLLSEPRETTTMITLCSAVTTLMLIVVMMASTRHSFPHSRVALRSTRRIAAEPGTPEWEKWKSESWLPRTKTTSSEEDEYEMYMKLQNDIKWYRNNKDEQKVIDDNSNKIQVGPTQEAKFYNGQGKAVSEALQARLRKYDAKITKYAEKRTLPLFPLDDGQCFPTGTQPLHLFMMPFRMMMNDIQESDKMFGIVMSNPQGGLCEIGTAVENVHRGMNPPSLSSSPLTLSLTRRLHTIYTLPYLINNLRPHSINLAHPLTLSLPPSLPPSPSHSLSHSLSHPLTHPSSHSPIQNLSASPHSLTHSLTHPLTHSLTHPLTHSLTHPPTL